MKILILIIYSRNEQYEQMLAIQKKYVHKNENIASYFIEFEENLNSEVELVDDFIYVRGKEHLLNITEKTIKSLKYLLFELNREYDYIVRTNISTVINHDLLLRNLEKMSRINIYSGGHLFNLQWLDHRSGIFDEKYFGTIFAQGTGIVFSKDVIVNMLENCDKINYTIVDDVTIAIYMKTYNIETYKNVIMYRLPYLYYEHGITNIHSVINHVFIRNNSHSQNRNNDIIDMENQVKYLYG